MSNEIAILSTAYLPPIEYFALIAKSGKIFIEAHENYIKQSYRNRCEIYGANGKLPLSIPVKKNSSSKILIKDVRIDYSMPWQRLHWISIESAYRSSPFFEYYMDEFQAYYNKKHEFLFDYNMDILSTAISILELDTEIILTDDFIPVTTDNKNDFRYSIHPKSKNTTTFKTQEYVQVFNDKHGFIPNLSIIDLICNEGPNAESLLIAYK